MIGFCILQIIYMPLMMLAANIMGTHQLGDSSMAGLLMAGGNVVGAIAAASFGTLFKAAKKWLLVIAWVFEAVGFAGIAFFGIFIVPEVSELVTYDERNGGEMTAALTAFFENACDVTKTAKAMHLHYNTVATG